MGKYPKHESREAFLRHRREGTHEMPAHLYRDNARPAQERKFEQRYGVVHGREVYGKVVGKVYREKFHHPYHGGRYPVGNEGHERPSKRHHCNMCGILH